MNLYILFSAAIGYATGAVFTAWWFENSDLWPWTEFTLSVLWPFWWLITLPPMIWLWYTKTEIAPARVVRSKDRS